MFECKFGFMSQAFPSLTHVLYILNFNSIFITHVQTTFYEDTRKCHIHVFCVFLIMAHIGPKHVGDYNNI
jgi:hypothetical protein